MAQTYLQRERRNAIAAWLLDRFGPPEDQINLEFIPDASRWRDAEDLIKFLRGNGFRIIREDDE